VLQASFLILRFAKNYALGPKVSRFLILDLPPRLNGRDDTLLHTLDVDRRIIQIALD
jgi:hypothetical protein